MSKAIAINEEQLFTDFGKLSKERKIKEEVEATKEIIRDKELLQSIIRGDEDFKAGRFKKWSEVKENV